MKNHVQIITRKELSKEWPDIWEELNWWDRLFIHVQSDQHGFYCPFTPWRLIATLFVPWSTWYKRRIAPQKEL